MQRINGAGHLPLPMSTTDKAVPSMPRTVATRPWKNRLERHEIAGQIPALSRIVVFFNAEHHLPQFPSG